MQSFIAEYLQTVQRAVGELEPQAIETAIEMIYRAYQEDRQIFTLGNGASAALASHMACDLGKGTAADLGTGPVATGVRRLRIIGLADNVALMTAYGNDVSYEDLFVEQLKNLLNPGDVVLGISGSGASPNVLRALEYARARGVVTVGLTGAQPKAALMKERCDHCVAVPLTLMEQTEDLHVVIHHIISLGLRQRILGGEGQA